MAILAPAEQSDGLGKPRPLDWPAALALLGGLAGVALYSIQFWSRPSLLLDEVRLSLDIAGGSWLTLTHPLGFDQTAPLLFLWAEKLATLVGGVNEYSLHLLPYLASVALLPLMWRFAQRLIGRWGAALAVAITAVSPLLAQYARQAKPYSLDALAAVLVMLWALDALDAPDDPRPVRRLMVAGIVGVWLSTWTLWAVLGRRGVRSAR